MTGILEAPTHLPEEKGEVREPADESSADRTQRSKEAVGTKSATKGSKSSRAASAKKAAKASRSRATKSGAIAEKAKGKASQSRAIESAVATEEAKEDGYLLAAHEVEEPFLNDLVATELQAVEPRVTESADHEESRPSSPVEGAQQEITRRRFPNWLAVRSWVGSNLLLSGVAVALAVAVAFLALTQLSLNSENSLNSVRTSALSAAKTYAVDLASYNYKHLDVDFGKVVAESTPAFKQNFTQSSEALKTAIVKYDATASANVVGAGLVSATGSRAVVLVFLNQTVDNTLLKGKPSPTESRVEITLVRSGGRWLIDQVSLL